MKAFSGKLRGLYAPSFFLAKLFEHPQRVLLFVVPFEKALLILMAMFDSREVNVIVKQVGSYFLISIL